MNADDMARILTLLDKLQERVQKDGEMLDKYESLVAQSNMMLEAQLKELVACKELTVRMLQPCMN